MIETGYFAKIKDYPETDELICVSYKYPWFVKKGKMRHLPRVAPEPKLLYEWKNGEITWEKYIQVYKTFLEYDYGALSEIEFLRLRSKDKTVRLMCWEKEPPCHRFILRDVILEAEQ